MLRRCCRSCVLEPPLNVTETVGLDVFFLSVCLFLLCILGLLPDFCGALEEFTQIWLCVCVCVFVRRRGVCVFHQTHCSIHPYCALKHTHKYTPIHTQMGELNVPGTAKLQSLAWGQAQQGVCGVCVCVCVCFHVPVCILLCLTCRDNVSSSFFLHETLWATWLSSVSDSKNLLHHICLLSSVLCLHSAFTRFDLHTTASYCLCVCCLKGSITHLSTIPQQQTSGCIQTIYWIFQIPALIYK